MNTSQSNRHKSYSTDFTMSIITIHFASNVSCSIHLYVCCDLHLIILTLTTQLKILILVTNRTVALGVVETKDLILQHLGCLKRMSLVSGIAMGSSTSNRRLYPSGTAYSPPTARTST